MKQTFEEFLQEYVARTEPHTDEMLPEIYADWLEQVDVQDVIDLAEKWHEQQMYKQAFDNKMGNPIEQLDSFLNAEEEQNER